MSMIKHLVHQPSKIFNVKIGYAIKTNSLNSLNVFYSIPNTLTHLCTKLGTLIFSIKDSRAIETILFNNLSNSSRNKSQYICHVLVNS